MKVVRRREPLKAITMGKTGSDHMVFTGNQNGLKEREVWLSGMNNTADTLLVDGAWKKNKKTGNVRTTVGWVPTMPCSLN
ncbi:hypothetical protein SOVF_172830 [Spinacia oleracea]|nr:hypothetical protein SOVF_172830 [Spinacia oleracea]